MGRDSIKVEYSIVYSDRKTLCMEIKDGKVIVKDSNKDTVAYAFDAEMFSK